MFHFLIPLMRKSGDCIAIAPLEIFTLIGPPMILQSDNGHEFNNAAMMTRQHGEYLEGKIDCLMDNELTDVITKVQHLWPECHMVCGLPHHSPSNGGVKQFN